MVLLVLFQIDLLVFGSEGSVWKNSPCPEEALKCAGLFSSTGDLGGACCIGNDKYPEGGGKPGVPGGETPLFKDNALFVS